MKSIQFNKILKEIISYIILAILFSLIVFNSINYNDEKGYYLYRDSRDVYISLNWTATQLEKWAGPADVGTYIRSAKLLLDKGLLDKGDLSYAFNLFPPGQIIFLASLIRITGEDHFPLKLLIISSLLWLLVFTVIMKYLNRNKASLLTPFLVLLPVYFFSIREYIFGYGLLGAEMLSMPLFMLLIFMILNIDYRNCTRTYLFAIALIAALLAYMRGYFEILGNFTIIIFLLYVFFNILFKSIHLYKQNNLSLSVNNFHKTLLNNKDYYFPGKMRNIALVLFIFVILLLPWRIINLERNSSLSWLHVDYYWSLVWKKDEATYPSFRKSALNTACHANSKLCDILSEYKNSRDDSAIPYQLYKRLTFMTLITSPIDWYSYKLQYIDYLWYGNNWVDEAINHTWLFIEGLFLLIMPVFFWLFYNFNRNNTDKRYKDFCFASIGFIIFNLILFTILHFEMRYSIFLKLYFISMFIFILNNILQRKTNSN